MWGMMSEPKQPSPQSLTRGPALGAAEGLLADAQPKMTYEDWKKKYAPHDSGKDYDLKGAWKAGLVPTNGHFPDTFKFPDHPRFSIESIYWKPGMPAGRWEGENYIRMTGAEATAWVKQHGQNLAPAALRRQAAEAKEKR